MSILKNIKNEIEDLISTASKANTEAISEAAKFISHLDKSKLNLETLREVEKKLLSEALLSITKLNIKYATDLIQLGVTLTKHLNENSSVAANMQESNVKSSVSAFEIKTSALAGEMATAAFLLNSDKNEPIFCEVTNSVFMLTSDTNIGFDATVNYTPQSFELIKGNAQRVDISIPVPADVVSGSYKSMISVKGFEHVHFDLLLQVIAPVKQEVVKTQKAAAPVKAKKKAVKKTAKKAKKKE